MHDDLPPGAESGRAVLVDGLVEQRQLIAAPTGSAQRVELVEYEPAPKRGGAFVRRTRLGQQVAMRYSEELATGRPIRWPQAAPRRATPAQRARFAELTAHIEALCEEHGVKWLRKATPGSAHALQKTRTIRSPKIRSRSDYFTALHEIAQLLDGRTSPVLEVEGSAWAWAIENACVRPTQADKAMIRRALRSHKVGGWDEPPRGHRFWRLLEHGTLAR